MRWDARPRARPFVHHAISRLHASAGPSAPTAMIPTGTVLGKSFSPSRHATRVLRARARDRDRARGAAVDPRPDDRRVADPPGHHERGATRGTARTEPSPGIPGHRAH